MGVVLSVVEIKHWMVQWQTHDDERWDLIYIVGLWCLVVKNGGLG